MKRLFDIIASACGLIVLSPLFFIVSVWIKLDSIGPIFYRQVRVGRYNKDFKIFKFRTMRVGADKGSLVTIGGRDPRVTRIGYYLRKFKIDELPQLINILNGTMSIVGPRPAAVDQVEITRGGENAIAATVPCGLTSQSSLWDYIYGDQFPDENEYNDKVLSIRLKLDVYYVKHASFFGDIQLIWWTVLAILYTACGKYPQWMHDKLVEYSKTV